MLNTRFCYRQSQELTHGITNRDLSLKRMSKVRIFLPPKPLQAEFVDRVGVIRELEFKQRREGNRNDELFQSLLHRHFD